MSMEVEQLIVNRVKEGLNPLYCEVVNESRNHLSGQQNPQAETHFKLVVVSEAFESLNRLERHRQIYSLLDDVLRDGVHALALHLFAPAEWQQQVPESPPCAGQNT